MAEEWSPDFAQSNPYAGMPADYAKEVAATFVPTATEPLSPVQVAATLGLIDPSYLPPPDITPPKPLVDAGKEAQKIIVTIKDTVLTGWSEVLDWLRNFPEHVRKLIGDALGNAWDWLKGIFSGIGGWFTTIFNNVGDWISSIYNTVKMVVVDWFANIKDWFGNVVSALTIWITTTWSDITSSFKTFVEGIADKFQESLTTVWEWIANKLEAVAEAFSEGFAWLADRFEDLLEIPGKVLFNLFAEFFFEKVG